MKHCILGAGNLGIDLLGHLNNDDGTAFLMGTEYDLDNRFEYPCEIRIDRRDADVVWCCIGAGSIEKAKYEFPEFVDLHVRLVADLIRNAPKETHLIFFSTDYVANEMAPSDPEMHGLAPRSLYAYSKLWMEQLIRASNRPRTVAIRIGSLYGNHRPERTFPGKLKKRAHTLTPINLPTNRCTPTPTWWLAEILAANWKNLFARDRVPIHHLAPKGNATIMGWARLFMPDKFAIKPAGIDPERPAVSYLGCTVPGVEAPDWKTLWDDERNTLR